jgi:hypothetical protein
MKYILNLIDLRSEVEWEQKSMLVFYVDLVTGQFDVRRLVQLTTNQSEGTCHRSPQISHIFNVLLCHPHFLWSTSQYPAGCLHHIPLLRNQMS